MRGSARAMSSARYAKTRSVSATCPTISTAFHSFGPSRRSACSGVKPARSAAVSPICRSSRSTTGPSGTSRMYWK